MYGCVYIYVHMHRHTLHTYIQAALCSLTLVGFNSFRPGYLPIGMSSCYLICFIFHFINYLFVSSLWNVQCLYFLFLRFQITFKIINTRSFFSFLCVLLYTFLISFNGIFLSFISLTILSTLIFYFYFLWNSLIRFISPGVNLYSGLLTNFSWHWFLVF